MKYIEQIKDGFIVGKTAVTLGKFDGIHRGHQKLIRKVTEKRQEGFHGVVFTFDRPAEAFLCDRKLRPAAQFLLTREERHDIFNDFPLDYVVECPFTEDIIHMEPEAFIKEVLVDWLHIGYIAVGPDFRFGYQAKGDRRLLERLAPVYGYELEVVDKVLYKDEEISSTRIRRCIEEGRIEEAGDMLGFAYPVRGEVIHGRKLGRTLGIPTANICPPAGKLLPPYGVYATKTFIEGKVYPGITNIGCKPTVSSDMMRGAENFLFDYNGDLYGKIITISLCRFERPEEKFESIEQLKSKMQKDMQIVRKYLVDNC